MLSMSIKIPNQKSNNSTVDMLYISLVVLPSLPCEVFAMLLSSINLQTMKVEKLDIIIELSSKS